MRLLDATEALLRREFGQQPMVDYNLASGAVPRRGLLRVDAGGVRIEALPP
jgi:hypothetical protein